MPHPRVGAGHAEHRQQAGGLGIGALGLHTWWQPATAGMVTQAVGVDVCAGRSQ